MSWLKRLIIAPFIVLARALLQTRLGREALYAAFAKNSFVVANADKEKYILNSSDNVIGRYTFSQLRAFDSDKIDQVVSLLPKGLERSVLVDIGANIGTIGIHAICNRLFERCVAFEPEPGNFRLLSANIALNDLGGRIQAHNVALSDGTQGDLEFELSGDNFGDHRVRMSSETGLFREDLRAVIKVPARRLDDYMDGIDLSCAVIWMDTQGFEGHVLAGAGLCLARKVPLVTEFWPYGLKRAQGFEHFVSAIEAANYTTLIDLNTPDVRRACSREVIMALAAELGDDGKFTDVIIF